MTSRSQKWDSRVLLLWTLLLLVGCQRSAPPGVDTPPAPLSSSAITAASSRQLGLAQVQINYSDQVATIQRGQSAKYAISVTNHNRLAIDATGLNGAYVTYKWLASDGKVVVENRPKTSFQSDIQPGQSAVVGFSVTAPPEPGSYILKVFIGMDGIGDSEGNVGGYLHYGVTVL